MAPKAQIQSTGGLVLDMLLKLCRLLPADVPRTLAISPFGIFPLTFYKSDAILPRALVEQLGGVDLSQSTDILQGTLDLLILKTVALEPMHGWGIAQRIQQVSKEVLQVQQGSLYPALYRLERKGLIAGMWGESENNRRAKYYSLTDRGREQLEKEQAEWERLSSAVALILQRI